MAQKEKWIPKNLKTGSFTNYCTREGFGGVTVECISKAKKSKNPTTRKRAVLAQTFRKMSKNK